MQTEKTSNKAAPMHYWTGRGSLCSLDNNVERQPNHTPYKADVTCPYCVNQLRLNSPPMDLRQ